MVWESTFLKSVQTFDSKPQLVSFSAIEYAIVSSSSTMNILYTGASFRFSDGAARHDVPAVLLMLLWHAAG